MKFFSLKKYGVGCCFFGSHPTPYFDICLSIVFRHPMPSGQNFVYMLSFRLTSLDKLFCPDPNKFFALIRHLSFLKLIELSGLLEEMQASFRCISIIKNHAAGPDVYGSRVVRTWPCSQAVIRHPSLGRFLLQSIISGL